MRRRVISLWFPHLAAERALRSNRSINPKIPFVVVGMRKSALRLCSINGAAEAQGLRCGMALADARAMFPNLMTEEEQPKRDAAFLRALVRWGMAYTPWVAMDGEDGLTLDITGCDHLFGGEAQMARVMAARLHAMHLTVRWSLADTKGAAWALARYASEPVIAPTGGTKGVISSLPVLALRIDEATATTLSRLGLREIGDVAGMSRGGLVRRFGPELMRRLDQIMGVETEPVAPVQLITPYAVRLALPDPIGKTEGAMAALRRLLDRLCERLERDQRGAIRLSLAIQRTDHSEDSIEIGLARPTRDPERILRLFEPRVDKLDAGFGIDAMRLHASATEPLVPEQSTVQSHAKRESNAITDLIGRLGNRIGFDRVMRFLPAESHIPERTFIVASAAYSTAVDFPYSKPERPLVLFQPEPIVPNDETIPPALFRWRGTAFITEHSIGPERIAPEWWWDDPNWRSGVRDYWRVQTAEGRRLWLFHAKGGEVRGGWFAHGMFG